MLVWRHIEKGLENHARNVKFVLRTNNFSMADQLCFKQPLKINPS